MRWRKASARKPLETTQSAGRQFVFASNAVGWHELLAGLFLTLASISGGFADTTSGRVLLPIEVLGTNGAVASRTVALSTEQAESARSLWMQIHGLRYVDEGSVQINAGPWIPLNNITVTIAEPGRSFGGIGGGFATLVMNLPLPAGIVAAGTNTIRFRFNETDGVVSAYRVLAWNFVSSDGRKLLSPESFAEDAPETWTPPLPDSASIEAGRELWHTASLAASSLPNSPKIQAHCTDCHAHDGRDLKYFNFSNASIVARSRFHGLSNLQGEQIASYIRALPLPNPGRPWNPPYQPGPGLDNQPVSNWAAGAGLTWVLEQDTDALQYLVSRQKARMTDAIPSPGGNAANLRELVGLVTVDIFRPDGNLNPREIPIALQLPDWSGWLPRVHPKDAWGTGFTNSEFAAFYGEQATADGNSRLAAKAPLRTILANAQGTHGDTRHVVASFAEWSQARRTFLKRMVKSKMAWSPALTNKIYSTQLWQLVKTWEMMQEYGLEERGQDLLGLSADSRAWCNTIPAEAAPSTAQIPNGPAGVGGSALTNEYFNAAWYELQIILGSTNHQHRDRAPMDWVYVIGRFHDLYDQTRQPEPARLLVAVIKAMQSTDPHLGPADLRRGWRPDQNIDPRILISPVWAPVFKPLPIELHRVLTASLLAAWLDKNVQYPISEYLPVGVTHPTYTPVGFYGEISGGRAWEAARQFRDLGVAPELVARLEQWGTVFIDRAARLQYEGLSSSRKK